MSLLDLGGRINHSQGYDWSDWQITLIGSWWSDGPLTMLWFFRLANHLHWILVKGSINHRVMFYQIGISPWLDLGWRINHSQWLDLSDWQIILIGSWWTDQLTYSSIDNRNYFLTSKGHVTWIIKKVNRIPTYGGVAYESVHLLARGHVTTVYN